MLKINTLKSMKCRKQLLKNQFESVNVLKKFLRYLKIYYSREFCDRPLLNF